MNDGVPQPILDCGLQLRIVLCIRVLHSLVEVVPHGTSGICAISPQGLRGVNMVGGKYMLVAAICMATLAIDDRKLGNAMRGSRGY